ncbi:MAG: hypothetical protein IJ169_00300 [Paludibacteraceae bacterium]|nr:hypothetical protein [Paludibacteraceae bacterium]
MKKFLLMASMLLLTMGMFAQTNDAWKSATPFNWDVQNTVAVGDTVWFAVDLTGVQSDEDVLLYVNNATPWPGETANMTAMVYVWGQKTFGGQTYESISPLEDTPRKKAIAYGHNYAFTLQQSIIKNFNLQKVYVKLFTDKAVTFAAEAVEAGEKDLDCLNAPEVKVGPTAVTKTYSTVGKVQWYAVNVAHAKKAGNLTVKVTLTNNNASESAYVEAGVSFDCPSTGVTGQNRTLKPGEVLTKTMDRSYLQMMADSVIYVKVQANQKLTVKAEEVVDATVVTPKTITGTIIELDTLKVYTLPAGGGSQWYSIDLDKLNGKRQMPEVTLENLGTGSNKITAEVAYENPYTYTISRTTTMAKGAVRVEEIQSNVVKTAVEKTEELHPGNHVAYICITSTDALSFIARSKARTEGNDCAKAKVFDWKNGNAQMANTTEWYAVDIRAAKDTLTNGKHDIKLYVDNRSSNTATLDVKVAFECPYTTTTDQPSTTIPANKTSQKVIKYSLFGNLAADTIYVRLTTTQNVMLRADTIAAEAIAPIYVCSEAAKVQMEQDYVFTPATAGVKDSVWYKVALADLKDDTDATLVPLLTVTNLTSSKANIKAEVAFSCPVTDAMQSKTTTIAAMKSQEKLITSDLLKTVSADTAYVRLISDRQISFRVEFKHEDEGSSCNSAKEFVWDPLFENYTTVNQGFWYAVNIATAKANKQNIEIYMQNLSADSTANIKGEMVFECTSTTPTVKSYTLKPKADKTYLMKYGTFSSVKSDIVYIKLTSNTELRLKAKLVDDETPVTDFCQMDADGKLIEYDWNLGNDQAAGALTDTVWYKINLDTLRERTQNFKLTPQAEVTNNTAAGAKADVIVMGSFLCQARSMMQKSITIAAGNTYKKYPEADVIAQLEDSTWGYFGIITSEPIHFYINMINPDQGQDCAHAADFDWQKGNWQEAGNTLWYLVDLTTIKNASEPVDLVLHLQNTDNTSGRTSANLYWACPESASDEPFANYNYDLATGKTVEKRLSYNLIANTQSDTIMIELFAQQAVHFWADTIPAEKENITACSDNVQMEWNTDITQTKDTVWYMVDMKELNSREFDNLQLTINPVGAATAFKAEIAYECPVQYKMDSKGLNLNAGQGYFKEADRSVLKNITADTVYLRLTADKVPFTFHVELAQSCGDCQNPTLFDWEYGNIHSRTAESDTCWYVVDIKQFRQDDTKEAEIIVKNLSEAPANVWMEVWDYCYNRSNESTQEPMGGKAMVKTIAVGDSATKRLSQALLKSYMGNDSIYIYLHSDQKVKIFANIIEPEDTVEVNVTVPAINLCYGEAGYTSDYYDFTFDVADFGMNGLQETKVITRDTVVYTDWKAKTGPIDSIFTFTFRPITPLDTVPFNTQINVIAGEVIDTTAVTAWLETQFAATAAVDTVAKYAYLKWYVYDDENGWQAFTGSNYETQKVGFGLEELTLRYVLTDSCHLGLTDDMKQGIEYDFTVDMRHRAIIPDTVAVCADSVFALPSGKTVALSADKFSTSAPYGYQLLDSVAIPGTAYDSLEVYKFEFRLNQAPEFSKSIDNYAPARLKAGELPDFTAATAAIMADLKADSTTNKDNNNIYTASVQGIRWEVKENGTWNTLRMDTTVSFAQDSLLLHYMMLTPCGEYASDSALFEVDMTNLSKGIQRDTVCANTPVTYTMTCATTTEVRNIAGITADTVLVDTIYHQIAANKVIAQADSVFLTVMRNLTLPATLTKLADVQTAVVGAPIDFTAVDTELRDSLDAKIAADPAVATYTTIAWQVEGADVAALSYTPAAVGTLNATYAVFGMDCRTDSLTFDFTINVAAPDTTWTFSGQDTVLYACVAAQTVDTVYMPETVTFDNTAKTYTGQFKTETTKPFVALTLPATVAALPATAVLGEAIDLTAANAEVKTVLDAQLSDSITGYGDSIVWSANGNRLPALSYTPDAVGTLTLSFAVTSECNNTVLTSNDFNLTVTPSDTTWVFSGKNTVIYACVDAVSVDTIYHPETAVTTSTAITAQFDTETTKPYMALTLPATVSALPATMNGGETLDLTAANTEVKAALDAQISDSIIGYNDKINWLVNGTVLTSLNYQPAAAGVITVNFAITSECAGATEQKSADFTITVGKMVTDAYLADTTYRQRGDTIITYVCEGEESIKRDTLATVELVDTIDLAPTVTATDSVLNHQINYRGYYTVTAKLAYGNQTLPADIVLLQAVCDETIHFVDSSVTALKAYFDKDTTLAPVAKKDIKWTWKDATGNYVEFGETKMPSDKDNIDIRLTVTTECGQTLSQDFTIDVEKPTYENSQNLKDYSNFLKQEYNRVILFNYKKLVDELKYDIPEKDVKWYKVVGQCDLESTETDDELVKDHGYYYTLEDGAEIVGDYYVYIEVIESTEYPCGAEIRSQVITMKSSAAAPKLTPNMVRPAETMRISNLDAEQTYEISVYDLTGVCLERYTVSGTEEYLLEAQAASGYYMVNVKAQDMLNATLKYVVK